MAKRRKRSKRRPGFFKKTTRTIPGAFKEFVKPAPFKSKSRERVPVYVAVRVTLRYRRGEEFQVRTFSIFWGNLEKKNIGLISQMEIEERIFNEYPDSVKVEVLSINIKRAGRGLKDATKRGRERGFGTGKI